MEMFAVEDKAVSTSDDTLTNYYDGRKLWNVITVENFVNTLITNKLISINEMESINEFDPGEDSESSMYSLPVHRERGPLDKRQKKSEQRGDLREQKHCPHCPKHRKNEENKRDQRSSISKVQKWSDDYDMETSFNDKSDDELRVLPPDNIESSGMRSSGATDDFEMKPPPPKRRKRRKRRVKKVSQIDPEDLPKRARWTIIITSGILILSCMFLVGVTLRMAPVIDELVKSQNIELMNSLNRDQGNPSGYYSLDGIWEKSPQERAKDKYRRQ